MRENILALSVTGEGIAEATRNRESKTINPCAFQKQPNNLLRATGRGPAEPHKLQMRGATPLPATNFPVSPLKSDMVGKTRTHRGANLSGWLSASSGIILTTLAVESRNHSIECSRFYE